MSKKTRAQNLSEEGLTKVEDLDIYFDTLAKFVIRYDFRWKRSILEGQVLKLLREYLMKLDIEQALHYSTNFSILNKRRFSKLNKRSKDYLEMKRDIKESSNNYENELIIIEESLNNILELKVFFIDCQRYITGFIYENL